MSTEDESPSGWSFPIWIMLKARAVDDRLLVNENRRLFLGYLAGFTEPVEDERRRAIFNKVLLDTIFGDGQEVMRDVWELAGANDPDFMRGLGFGYPDGERFWAVCDERLSCDSIQAENVFVSLEAMTIFLK